MSHNRGHDYVELLGPEAEGRPLVAWLASRYAHSTARAWEERIEAGRVLLDGRPARAGDVLRRGQTLVWRRPPWEEPGVPSSFAVLFRDDDLLAVAKPAGLPTLPGGGFLENTLLCRIRAHDPHAAPVHRLGRWTSGVVLFARSGAARAELSRQWAARTVFKRYRALASGDRAQNAFTVAAPIGPLPHPLLGSVHGVRPDGKPASTEVVIVERREGAFLCDVLIGSGRPHQIRIHLAAAGHPLAGDPLYGPGGTPLQGSAAVPGDPGYLLHAAELSIRHPRTGLSVTIACMPPEVLRARARRGADEARSGVVGTQRSPLGRRGDAAYPWAWHRRCRREG